MNAPSSRIARAVPVLLAWSLIVFVQLGFGQWLTKEFNGAFQHFMYFSGTLLALHFVQSRSGTTELTRP